MTLNDVAQRYGVRPGYRLADAIPVALPVYEVNIDAIVIARKKIALTDEFILRAIGSKVACIRDLCGFLGLEEHFVVKRVARLANDELLHYDRDDSGNVTDIRLAPKGIKVLDSEAHSVRPRRQSLRFLLDGITRKPITSYAGITRDLLQPKQAKEWGLMEIRAFPNTPPDGDELRKFSITEALPARIRKEGAIHQVMEVVKIGHRYRRLREGVMLIFQSETNALDVAVSFFIDGRPANEIDQSFVGADGIRKLRLAEQVDKSRSDTEAQLKAGGFGPLLKEANLTERKLQDKLEPTLQKIGAIAAEAQIATQQVENSVPSSETAKLHARVQELERERERLEAEIKSVPVRHLRVHEHRPLFENCLKTCQKHLLIIAPWINDHVLTDVRLNKIADLLKRGVKVSIGYGINDDGKARNRDIEGRDAIKRLDALQQQFPKTLVFHRLGNTHEKVLIKDEEFAVIGSFNWFSFEGRADGKVRCEASLMVTHPDKVRELMHEYTKRFPRN